MDASQLQINTWQGWFELLKSVYSTDGWLNFLAYTREDSATADDDTLLARVYTIPIQINLNVTLLLACLQTPPEQVDTVLTSISKHIASIRFEKTPRKLKRSERELYRQTVEIVTRMIPITCEVISQILKVYVSDAYDPAADANAIMREAQAFSAARDRTKALNAIARAGAAGLRGARIWTGWGMEGTDEFCSWGLAVITMVAALRDALPLESYAQQRQKMDELIARLQPHDETVGLDDDADDMNGGINDVMNQDLQSLTDDIFAIAGRSAPLSDDEIRAMGDKYDLVAEFALRCIELYDASEDENLDLNSLRMVGITCLGILRYTRSMAIDRLIHLIVAEQDNDEEEWSDEAVIALENIGAPALPAVFDYVRYTSLEDARDLLLEVLAVIGRGNQEVKDYLLQNFTENAWSGDRVVYAQPLALLHDQSTVPLFVAALREPGLRDADAWALLDALQELNVTFFVNHDQSAVDIPGYGVIEGVLPVDWQSRQEMDEEVSEWEEEWEEGDDVLDDEDKDDDINDEDQLDDEVVYDKNGTPHCPDCGAEMHYVDGAWVHEEDLVEPKSIKPQIKPVGRNDPCPCGSGKKYKYCHGRE